MIGQELLHFIKAMIGLDSPRTQTTAAERTLLKKHLQGKRKIVEVGVYEGFTTRWLAESAEPDAMVYAVDPFFPGRLGFCYGKQIAIRYNRKYLAEGRLKLIGTPSIEVGDKVPAKVDFVFIDADHSLKGITEDWQFWSARVSPSGIMALHDTLMTPDRPTGAELGSHQYFRSHIAHDPRFSIIEQVDSLSVLRKI